jgi:hypothetical protein
MRGLRSKRVSDARELVQVLNSSRSERGFERVAKVIGQINRYGAITRERDYATARLAGDDAEILIQARQLQRDINDFLDRTKVWVQFGPSGRWRWMPRSISKGRGPSHSFSTGEALVLDAIINGYIGLVRRCPSCSAWFVVGRPWQQFCPGACREKHFRKSPEGKAMRAKYMRKYRAGLKRLAENLRLAARKRQKR